MKKVSGKKRKRETKIKNGKKIEGEKAGFFPEKLFKILQDEKNNSLIHWDKEGKVVEIENGFKFSKIIEKNFKHKNYDSFVRQLNLYGFEKLINLEKSFVERFTLPTFTKESTKEDIKKIKRKKIVRNNNDKKEREEIEENDKKIDEFLKEIKKEEDDFRKIEKYKSIINDDKININNKLIKNILEYIDDKKKQINNNNNKYKFILMKNSLLPEEEKPKNKINILKRSFRVENPIQKGNEFIPPSTHINKKVEYKFNKEDLKSSFFSVQSNDTEQLKNLLLPENE